MSNARKPLLEQPSPSTARGNGRTVTSSSGRGGEMKVSRWKTCLHRSKTLFGADLCRRRLRSRLGTLTLPRTRVLITDI
jgi:hypothetical protein